jgi:hypothetical protein
LERRLFYSILKGKIMSNTVAVGVAYSDPEFTTVYASQELGYASSAQGSVTQLTSKSTGVTLNKSAGRITMNNAALAAGSTVLFTLTNSMIGAKDVLVVNVGSGGTSGAYWPYVATLSSGSAVIGLYNNTAGSLSESPVINFAVIHGE